MSKAIIETKIRAKESFELTSNKQQEVKATLEVAKDMVRRYRNAFKELAR